MMKEKRAITYSQWLKIIHKAKEKGISSDELQKLYFVYPTVSEEGYYNRIQNEIAQLETVLLKNIIDKFELSVNHCLNDLDLEILNSGIREFKKNICKCFFFCAIEEYPCSIRRDLCGQITENLTAFVEEYNRFVNTLSMDNNSLFIQDFEYICKKAKLKKYIEEFQVYG